jgi:hypothetical protein
MDEVIKHKECDGCYSITSGFTYCNGVFNVDGICPCTHCLVKPMCKSECGKYKTFKDIIVEFRFKKYEDKVIIKELEKINNVFSKNSM